MGIEDIVWFDEIWFYWDEVIKEFCLEWFKMQMEGIGIVEVFICFVNVFWDLFEDLEGQGQVVLVVVQFVDVCFSFVDDGVMKLGLESMVEE